MKPWNEIPEGRERDAGVAELVMGWRLGLLERYVDAEHDDYRYRHPVSGKSFSGSTYSIAHITGYPVRDDGKTIPHFTTDPSADYSVLEFVRREWDEPQLIDFCAQLESLCYWQWSSSQGRGTSRLYYMPGFYSAAAYEAKRLAQGDASNAE